MTVALNDVLEAANGLLKPEKIPDYCPNGLQIQGNSRVAKIVSGVTACQRLIDRAVTAGADLLLVHHGYFWKGEPEPLTGIKRRRIATLLQHDISLVAYHLPLDIHPRLGNNARLAALLDIDITGGLEPGNPDSVGLVGQLQAPVTAQVFAEKVGRQLNRAPMLVQAGDHLIRTLAWCTGAAQGYIEKAAALGVDAYLSGEISEPTVHVARETHTHYLAAGHHATERYGVQALGQELARLLPLAHEFIDIDNPA
jgi:dinuclear metal center YbgI/SA1388 family protein